MKIFTLIVRFAGMTIEAFRNEIDEACRDENLVHVIQHPDGVVLIFKHGD